jgi:hypothetical protein
MFGSTLSDGDHVIAARHLGGLFGPSVRRGSRGIVRGRSHGFFSTTYNVEFAPGQQVAVSGRNLKRAFFGHGEASWERHHELRRGFHLGLLILAMPAIIGVVRYYLHGGSTAGLIGALPGAIAGTVLSLGSRAVGLLGVPLFLIICGLLWLHHRRR